MKTRDILFLLGMLLLSVAAPRGCAAGIVREDIRVEPTTSTSTEASTSTVTSTEANTSTGSSTEASTTTEDNANTGSSGSTEEPTEAPTASPGEEALAKQAIDDAEAALHPFLVEYTLTAYDNAVNNNTETFEAAKKASEKYNEMYTEIYDGLMATYDDSVQFKDQELQRRYDLIVKPGTAALSVPEQNQLAGNITEMNDHFLSTVCPYDDQSCDQDQALTMDDLEVVMATERNPAALEYYWVQWRNKAGKPTKEGFVNALNLQNAAAQNPDNGFNSSTEMWLQPYIAPDYSTLDFQGQIESLWAELKPLYKKILGYVRYRLMNSDEFKDVEGLGEQEALPAHILGNMWAQSWENIYDLVVPYPDVELVNITESLNENFESVEDMFREAEAFFESIGLYKLNDNFWPPGSYLEQKDGYVSVCHASAWDFYSREGDVTLDDFRIKMCTDKNQEDFITIHHEMGHIQYFMAYAENDPPTDPKPLMFRTGANPGFHEAIGDTIALSVSTPGHLEKLSNGPIPRSGPKSKSRRPISREEEDKDQKLLINQLMMAALEKYAFLPYAYILDKFRWDAFDGVVSEDEYNYHWWQLRLREQGVRPPVLRTKDDDFDIGCKYHVANNVPYVRYFVAFVLQYQFHEQLCIKADHQDVDIQNCDIDGYEDAGALLKDMMMKGNSQPWTKTLEEFLEDAENKTMNARAILNYFAPLNEWLTAQEKELGYSTEWDTDDNTLDEMFVVHIPATVPIVVGVVLAVMIVVVVVAYFVGKRRQGKVLDPAMAEEGTTKGESNPGFELGERRKDSDSSHSSHSSKKSHSSRGSK